MPKKPKRMILIEPDRFYVDIIGTFEQLFRQEEYRAVSTLQEAEEVMPVFMPDIIVLDLEIGKEVALRFVEGIREDTANKGLPILVFCKDKKAGDDALTRGCSAFLVKPFRVRELEMMLERLLKQ